MSAAERVLHERVPLLRLVGITMFCMAFGTCTSVFPLFLFAKEAAILFPDHASVGLGCLCGVAGLAHLAVPIAGRLSDTTFTRLGRRQPFILVGSMVCLVGLILMGTASYLRSAQLYLPAVLVGMIGLNTAQAAENGLVPDFVSASQAGQASGVVALQHFAGSIVGFSTIAVLALFPHADYRLMYVFVMAELVICVVITVMSASERCYDENQLRSVSIQELLTAFYQPLLDPDFFWVWLSRTIYYFAVSAHVFLFYFVRDVVVRESQNNQELQFGIMALLAQFSAALIAFPAGQLSQLQWVGRKLLIYIAGALLVASYFSFLQTPMWSTPYRRIAFLYFVSLLYGIGNGLYVGVDYAIALDCLPCREAAAQYLGTWSIGSFLGGTIGPLLGGMMLHFSGRSMSRWFKDGD